jgi:putative ABC transport system permease protein
MVSLAKENIVSERFKISLSVLGVVASIFLIMILFGLTNGLGYVVELPIRETEADLWITSQDSYGSLHSPSLVPIDLEINISSISGVKNVQPLIRIPVTVNIENTDFLLYIMAYDPGNEIGKPWNVISGEENVKNNQIIIDKALKQKTGLSIGDTLQIKDHNYEIIGISDDSSMMIAFIVFMTLENAKILLPGNLTSFFVIQVSEDFSFSEVKTSLETEIEGISVNTSDTVAEQYRSELLDGFIPILIVLSLIGAVVAVLIIGMFIYSLTLEKSREYAIVKALGASNMYLYKIVLSQSLIVSILGLVISLIFVTPIIDVIRNTVPEFAVRVSNEIILFVIILSFVTAFISSLLPVRGLTNIDPVIVFKEA